ncbi:putative membrane protein YczE [Paenibacillus sp. JGP012]|nr:putative membrane protein YczE [Paenibacillus sp. JGP012]
MAFIFGGPIGIGTALAVCFSGAILNVFITGYKLLVAICCF